jgi:prepilin-type N-terminal cleavage/methylation domain-containing protein
VNRRVVRGLTLIELLTALVILSFVVLTLVFILQTSATSQQTVVTQNDLQRQVRLASDAVMDSLRPAQAVIAGSATALTVSHLDGSTTRFFLDAGKLKKERKVSATSTPIVTTVADNVQGVKFLYFRSVMGSYLKAFNVSDVEAVQIDLTLSSGDYAASLSSSVRLRNKF